jgi:hypothetical protein
MKISVTTPFSVILSAAKNPVLGNKKSWILRYAQNDEFKKDEP